jgi:hypothetical protein
MEYNNFTHFVQEQRKAIMALDVSFIKQEIVTELDQLPTENLLLLRDFVAFLRSRQVQGRGRVVSLGGLWQPYQFSVEEINAARKEVWSSLGQDFDE